MTLSTEICGPRPPNVPSQRKGLLEGLPLSALSSLEHRHFVKNKRGEVSVFSMGPHSCSSPSPEEKLGGMPSIFLCPLFFFFPPCDSDLPVLPSVSTFLISLLLRDRYRNSLHIEVSPESDVQLPSQNRQISLFSGRFPRFSLSIETSSPLNFCLLFSTDRLVFFIVHLGGGEDGRQDEPNPQVSGVLLFSRASRQATSRALLTEYHFSGLFICGYLPPLTSQGGFKSQPD